MGIDYGMGKTNIDLATGIRFGVIHANDIGQAWYDSAESNYGEPTCPKCGNAAIESSDPSVPDFDEHDDIETDGCSDYYCEDCRYAFDSSDAYGEEPIGFALDDGEYKATQSGDDRDVFVLSSPYFTHAPFCSPCAPGAGYLRDGSTEGDCKAYCFGHDWFDGGIAPYPVYSVESGERVYPPSV